MASKASFVHNPVQVCPHSNSERIIFNGIEAWLLEQDGFLTAYLSGGNISQYTNPSTNSTSTSNSSLPVPDPRTSEDCLFLDVIAPQKIFNSSSTKKRQTGAPVLVWIYGGGYTEGDKSSYGNPASLIARSLENGNEGVVYVAMNYRLGLFVSCSFFLGVCANGLRAGYPEQIT